MAGGFVAAYPVPHTHRAIVLALCRRGYRKSHCADPECVIQWVPVSKVDWAPVVDGGMLLQCLPARRRRV